MINVICEKYNASVEARGTTVDMFRESLGLILEGFKIIRRIDENLYEKTKDDIFLAIADGKLDKCTETNDECEGQEIKFDLNGILEQLKEEDGEN